MNLSTETAKKIGDEIAVWPFRLAIGGLVAAALALLLSHVDQEPAEWLRAWIHAAMWALLAISCLSVISIVTQPRRSSLLLGLAAGSTWLCSRAVDPAWDSAKLALNVATVVASVAAVLVILPAALNKLALSLLVLFHFGAILTAVTSVPLPGGPGLWLANQLWFRVYRPYVQFMYLNNAYHFYAPEPGPATLLWCQIRYSDGSRRWAEIPQRSATLLDPLALQYYRRLAMNESVNQLSPDLTIPASVAELRMLGGEALGIPSPAEIVIRLRGVPQYRVPVDNAKRLLQAFARHLAHAYASDLPKVEVTGVRIYRFTPSCRPGISLRVPSPMTLLCICLTTRVNSTRRATS
jgi:hypothetical protein